MREVGGFEDEHAVSVGDGSDPKKCIPVDHVQMNLLESRGRKRIVDSWEPGFAPQHPPFVASHLQESPNRKAPGTR